MQHRLTGQLRARRLFLESIRNGFNLLEVNPYDQDIIRGGIILAAVGVDALSRRTA